MGDPPAARRAGLRAGAYARDEHRKAHERVRTRHGLGLLHRARVRRAAGLDARLRPRGDLAAGDDRRRARPGGARPRLRAAAGSASRSAGCGRRTCRPSSAARASARSSSASCTRSSARSPFAPNAFGNQAPDSGNSEILALAGTPEQKERYLHPLLAGDLKSAFSMTEPDTAGADPTQLHDPRGAGRRRLGHQRAQVVLLQRLDRRLPDRHGGHRPRRAAAPARLDVPRRRRHPRRGDRARRRRRWSTRRRASASSAATPRSATTDVRVGRRRAARRRGRGLPDRPAPARPRAHPPLHALARRRPGGRSTCSASAPLYRYAHGERAGREPDGAELDRGLRGADAGRAADDPARRLGHGHAGRERGAPGHRADQVLRRRRCCTT